MSAVSHPPADLSVRVAARALDVALVTALDVALGGVMGFGFDWLLAGTLVVLAYFTAFDVAGGTPGKRALGLRVVGPDGGRPTLGQALRREAFTVVGAVPFVGPILAFGAWIWIGRAIAASALRQGPHDALAGGTRVVRIRP